MLKKKNRHKKQVRKTGTWFIWENRTMEMETHINTSDNIEDKINRK